MPCDPSHKVAGGREQRAALAHRPKQVIEESRQSEVARGHDSETQTAVNEKNDSSSNYGEYIKDSGEAGLETRRRFCNPFFHRCCVHGRLSLPDPASTY